MHDYEIKLNNFTKSNINIVADSAEFTGEFLILIKNNEVIATFQRGYVVYIIRH